MKTRPQEGELLLLRTILQCCWKWPDRQDTLEGWTEWWIMENHISWAVTEVKRALNELVKRDLMVQRRAADGRIHYRANPKKLNEIGRLLGKGGRKTQSG